jgi:hypothetical protein
MPCRTSSAPPQREEHADAPERLLGVAERSQHREHREHGHGDGEGRDRRRLPVARQWGGQHG